MAMSPDQPPDILERLEDYAVEAIGLFRYLQEQSDRAGWDLGRQFLRAATSIGVNVEEAQAASSRKDFIYKYSIAQREARECRFFFCSSLSVSTSLQKNNSVPFFRKPTSFTQSSPQLSKTKRESDSLESGTLYPSPFTLPLLPFPFNSQRLCPSRASDRRRRGASGSPPHRTPP